MQEVNGCQISAMIRIGDGKRSYLLVSNQESDRHSVFSSVPGIDG